MVHPYVARRQRQHDAVQTPWQEPADAFWTTHPMLGSILHDTEGILLFQEQILEIAHQFAGLSYADADGFRRAMSHARTPDEMEVMRTRFVEGALAHGETLEVATRVFDAVSKFVGYGFCKSHAAEFARTIYQTAWLKAQYPAHYLAAFLSVQPAGFFPPHVVLEEAKLLGIPVLPVDVNRSEDRFTVERVGSPLHAKWAIRIGLRQVAQVGEDLARAILWERQPSSFSGSMSGSTANADTPHAACAARPFTSLADFCTRMRTSGLTWPAAEALVLTGAFTSLSRGLQRRRQLWRLHELWPLVSPSRPMRAAKSMRHTGQHADDHSKQLSQLTITWEIAPGELDDPPPLPALSRDERAALDYGLLGLSAQPHPMRLLRRDLRRSGIRAIAELAELGAGRVTQVAGWAISAQRPPTAKGMGFLVLEDETGRLPVALPPRLAADLHRILRDARVVAVCGRVEHVRWYRSLLALDLRKVG
jgi:error-prone DNA polymerase